jgi:putative membrane protein
VSIAQTIPIAYWGMHGGGWWILAPILMMVCMGAMMWMMMRGMGGRSSQSSSAPSDSADATQSALEILERRFARGEISVEEYRQRREILANGGAESNGAVKDEPLPAPSSGERRE